MTKISHVTCVYCITVCTTYVLGWHLVRLWSFSGQAVTVGVSMFVLSISELSEVGMVSTQQPELGFSLRLRFACPGKKRKQKANKTRNQAKNLNKRLFFSKFVSNIWFVQVNTIFFFKKQLQTILFKFGYVYLFRLTSALFSPFHFHWFLRQSAISMIFASIRYFNDFRVNPPFQWFSRQSAISMIFASIRHGAGAKTLKLILT